MSLPSEEANRIRALEMKVEKLLRQRQKILQVLYVLISLIKEQRGGG